MKKEDYLMPGQWFGEPKHDAEIALLKTNLISVKTEKECILTIVEILKSGDFSVKPLLIQLMNSSKDDVILNLCVRVFCSVCTHENLCQANNLRFLSEASEDTVESFASQAPRTLSYEVVPYLLALLEEWEDTNTEQVIKDSLNTILNFKKRISVDASIDEIGELYFEISKSKNNKVYYYEQEEVFPGILTRPLVEQAFISHRDNSTLKMSILPSLLSIWSGKKCPVYYYTLMDNEAIENLMTYIKELVSMDWKSGSKYFYYKKIEN